MEGPAMDKSASQSLGLVDFTMAGLERASGADLTPGAKPSPSHTWRLGWFLARL